MDTEQCNRLVHAIDRIDAHLFAGTDTVQTKGDVADGVAQVNLNPNYVGGRAEDASALPGPFTVGQAVGLRLNKSNGSLFVTQGNLDPSQDTVSNIPKPDATSTYAASLFSSTAYEASHIIKASAGTLSGFFGYNSGPTQWVQIHNSATVPADTAVPILILRVTATSNFSLELGAFSAFFSAGIVICNSTTGPTKTVGASDCWFNCTFK